MELFTVTLQVVLKDGTNIRFNSSPYSFNLEKYLVYLYEYHTSGTDLKIPYGSRAALTLGIDLPKDRLFQAAMRMLGPGH